MVKAPITKEYKTLEDIKRVIELEDDFHDAELMDMAIKNGDAWFGIWQYGHRFTFVCRGILNLEMNMDLKLICLYEVDIKQCEDGMELTFDEAGIVIKAKEVILEELILPKDYELTEAEKTAIKAKIEAPDVYVKCPRCGGELHYNKKFDLIDVRCYSDGCIKSSYLLCDEEVEDNHED